MARTSIFVLIVALFSTGSLLGLFAPARASAQTPTAFVALRDLTVEGRDAPDDMRAALDSQTTGVMHALDTCYASRHALRADLAGEMQLRLWVSALQVIRVTKESGTTTDDELYTCVKQRLLAFRLPPDSPRAGVTVRFRVVFTPPASGMAITCTETSCAAVPCGAMGAPCCPTSTCSAGVCLDALCQTPPPPPIPPVLVAVTRTRGGPTDAALAAEIDAGAFARCVGVPPSSTRARNSGTIPFSVTVRSTGVVSATPSTGTLNNRPTITCLRAAFTAMRLATRRRSTMARVTLTVPAMPAAPAAPTIDAVPR